MRKFKKLKFNTGLTYVELIVVLSIGAVLSSVSLFNYKLFQDKVDIKNVANDFALQVSTMQRNASAGKIPTHVTPAEGWRPSYGLYFRAVIPADKRQSFYLFVDLLSGGTQDKRLTSVNPCPDNECFSVVTLTKGNYLKEIKVKYQGGSIVNEPNLNLTFTRPNVGASFWTDTNELINVEYVEFVVSSGNGDAESSVLVYPSGRIEVK
jgi:type II secretory pathway pseudopilin PulG